MTEKKPLTQDEAIEVLIKVGKERFLLDPASATVFHQEVARIAALEEASQARTKPIAKRFFKHGLTMSNDLMRAFRQLFFKRDGAALPPLLEDKTQFDPFEIIKRKNQPKGPANRRQHWNK